MDELTLGFVHIGVTVIVIVVGFVLGFISGRRNG
jgi:hypothetical protein